MEQNASSHLIPPNFSAESFTAQFPGINAAANNASPLLMSTLHLSSFSNTTAQAFLPTATSQIALGSQFPADLANVATAAWTTQQPPWFDQAKLAAMLPMYGMAPQAVTSVSDSAAFVDPCTKSLLNSVPISFDHPERFEPALSQASHLQGQCSSTPSSASFESRTSPQRPGRVNSRVSSVNVDSPARALALSSVSSASHSQPRSNETTTQPLSLNSAPLSNHSLPVTPSFTVEVFTSPIATSKTVDVSMPSVSSQESNGAAHFANNSKHDHPSSSRAQDMLKDLSSLFSNVENMPTGVPNMNASGHFTFDHHPQPSTSHQTGTSSSLSNGIDHSAFDDLSWTKDINLDDFHLNYDTAADFHALLGSDLTADILKNDNPKPKDRFKADDFDKEFERHMTAVANNDVKSSSLPIAFDAFSSILASTDLPTTTEPQEKISLTPVEFTPPDSPSENAGTSKNLFSFDTFPTPAAQPKTAPTAPKPSVKDTLDTLSFIPKISPNKQPTKVPVYKQRPQNNIFSFHDKEKSDKADAFDFSDDEEESSPFGNIFSRDSAKDQKSNSFGDKANSSTGGANHSTTAEHHEKTEHHAPKSALADSIRKRREARAVSGFLHAESVEEDCSTVVVNVDTEKAANDLKSPKVKEESADEHFNLELPPLPKLYIKINRRDSVEREKKKKKKKRRKKEKDHEWEGSDHKKKKKKKHRKDRERQDSSSAYEARLVADDEAWRAPSVSSIDAPIFSRKRRLMMQWTEGESENGELHNESRKRTRLSPSICEVKRIDRFEEQWDPHLIKFSQAHGNLGKGTFVVSKQDLFKIESCALWRVDNQNLLQKYPPMIDPKTGRTMYKNSSTYSGWCDQIADGYLTIVIKYMKHSRAESIVEPEIPLVDLFPAISQEVNDRSTVTVDKVEKEEGVKEMLCFGKDALRVSLQTYLQAMLNHALTLNFLQSIKQTNEWNYLCSLNEVDKANTEGKTRIKEKVKWNPHFLEMVQQYSYCTVSDSDVSEVLCQACNEKHISNVIQLFSNEYYDYETLAPVQFPSTGRESPMPAMEFLVCSSCQQNAVLYHRLHHLRYHLLKKCEDKIETMSIEHPTMSATEVIDACVKQTHWVKQICDECVADWKKVGQL
uniref:DUF4211 domain-containing protein n=1 Tax=Steinernema glaseri TaxID=37863 RepID=A0A1I7Y3S1_9BILA